MTKKQPTSRTIDHWPALDQCLWKAATEKATFLEPDGNASHWADATKLQVKKGYGKWIFHLEQEKILPRTSNRSPSDRLNEKSLRTYLKRLEEQDLASQTIVSRLTDLSEAIRVMEPGSDISLLKSLIGNLQKRATPSRKKHARIQAPEKIWRACLTFMEQSIEEISSPNINQSSRYRDAMALGLLCQRPLRRRNISGLILGKHLKMDQGHWRCHITGTETKDRTPLSFYLPQTEPFGRVFNHYLTVIRQRLLRTPASRIEMLSALEGPLWISTRGKLVSDHAFYYSINRISEELLGAPLNPHLLRDCAASALSSDAPKYILAAGRILGHSTLNTTLSHYEQSSMIAAGEHLAATLENLQEQALKRGTPSTNPFDLPFQTYRVT